MLSLKATKLTAKDKGEDPSLNGEAGIVTTVEVTAEGSCILLCSSMRMNEASLSGETMKYLPSLVLYCHGLFLDSEACLCRLSNSSSMFRGDAAEEPESHIRGL